MTDAAPMVRLDGVAKSYGKSNALNDTTVEIRKGEFLALLGPSGSGKTTLLNMIAGMVSPSRGRIFIDEQDVTSVPPEERNIGMVFQNYALMPHMTVFENIAFPLEIRGMRRPEIKRRVAEVLGIVRLPDVGDRKPKELSGGQQQRISIARCIAYNPRLILMDEPLGALDKKLREQMQLEIKRLHTDLGLTMVYVTHDQEEALNMSDRIMLMNGGSIEQIGTPEDIYFNPVSLFVADFVGRSSLFDAEVIDVGETLLLRLADGTQCRAPHVLVPIGARGKLMLRPEILHLARAERQAAVGENVIPLNLIQVLSSGGMRKYYGIFGGREQVVVHEFYGQMTSQLPIGSMQQVIWSIENGLFIAANSANSSGHK